MPRARSRRARSASAHNATHNVRLVAAVPSDDQGCAFDPASSAPRTPTGRASITALLTAVAPVARSYSMPSGRRPVATPSPRAWSAAGGIAPADASTCCGSEGRDGPDPVGSAAGSGDAAGGGTTFGGGSPAFGRRATFGIGSVGVGEPNRGTFLTASSTGATPSAGGRGSDRAGGAGSAAAEVVQSIATTAVAPSITPRLTDIGISLHLRAESVGRSALRSVYGSLPAPTDRYAERREGTRPAQDGVSGGGAERGRRRRTDRAHDRRAVRMSPRHVGFAQIAFKPATSSVT